MTVFEARRIQRYLTIFFALAACAFGLAACGGDYFNDERKLAYIKVAPAAPVASAGGRIQFTAAGVDERGGALAVSPRWEAHEGKIDSAGVYIAPSYSTVDRVSAFVDAKVATAVVSVKKDPVAAVIKIYPELKYLSCGAKQKFVARGFNAYGEEVAVSVRWESRNGVISADGEYGAPLQPVADAIAAKTASATGALALQIRPREAYKIFISPKTARIKASGVARFVAAAYDIYGNKIEDELGFRYCALRGKMTDEGYYFAPNATGTDEIGVVFNYIRDSAQVELVP